MTEFLRAYPPAVPAPGLSVWLPFVGNDLLLAETGIDGQQQLIRGDDETLQSLLAPLPEPIYLGTLDGLPCLVCRVNLSAETLTEQKWQTSNLRGLYGKLDDTSYGLAGYAFQMIEWQRTSRYCPVCANPTETFSGDWGRRCTNEECRYLRYPPVSPAVLVLIHDGGNRVLLTHKAGWGKMFSLIAGFVEPGESLEECVRREVLEEVGVRLDGDKVLTYKGSQPWSCPHQLMVGFLAHYEDSLGDSGVKLDMQELDDAKWFDLNDLPALPPPLSLSRQIIDGWIKSRNSNS